MKYSQIYKTHCYCISLCRAENALSGFYDERLKEVGITIRQYCLLKNLDTLKEAGTAELANKVNLERTTLTRNIRILQKKGWIADAAEQGARKHRYFLTKEGEKILEKSIVIWEKTQREIEDYLGADRMKAFMEDLYQLQKLNLDRK